MINNRGVVYNKKSQSELLGFAIVVLLIAVGMLFVIGFVVLDQKPNTRLIYMQKQIATNLNDALSETATTCHQLTVNKLYDICMGNDPRICPEVDQPQGPGGSTTTTCEYLHGFITKRLSETLGGLGYDYKYSYKIDSLTAADNVVAKSPGASSKCGQQRSVLILHGDVKQAIIYLDVYDCKN